MIKSKVSHRFGLSTISFHVLVSLEFCDLLLTKATKVNFTKQKALAGTSMYTAKSLMKKFVGYFINTQEM